MNSNYKKSEKIIKYIIKRILRTTDNNNKLPTITILYKQVI